MIFPTESGKRYRLDVSEINFSQTFIEHSYSNKTLQLPNMFEQSVINKANPANFDLTFPVLRESDLLVLFNRILDYGTFDLYIVAGPNVFKIDYCVITNTTFNIERTRPLSLSIRGEAARITYEGATSEVILPGTLVGRSANRTYNQVELVNVIIGSKPPKDSLNAISIELNTDIEWIPYTTVNDAIAALNADTSMYPANFVVKKQELQGGFSAYALDEEEWGLNSTLFMQIGDKVGSNLYGFEFDIKSITFTNTLRTGDIFSQYYTWRMTQNPDSLGQVIKYLGLDDAALAIQDHLDLDILDHLFDPILEST